MHTPALSQADHHTITRAMRKPLVHATTALLLLLASAWLAWSGPTPWPGCALAGLAAISLARLVHRLWAYGVLPLPPEPPALRLWDHMREEDTHHRAAIAFLQGLLVARVGQPAAQSFTLISSRTTFTHPLDPLPSSSSMDAYAPADAPVPKGMVRARPYHFVLTAQEIAGLHHAVFGPCSVLQQQPQSLHVSFSFPERLKTHHGALRLSAATTQAIAAAQQAQVPASPLIRALARAFGGDLRRALHGRPATARKTGMARLA